MTELEFLQHYTQNASHMMWLLGAGASRSSGVRTANDLIWDLKRDYYCRAENQDVRSHDVGNSAVRATIQGYMDSRGFPPSGDLTEYSFYFELTFGTDYSAQQKYLVAALAPNGALSLGQRVLAALLALGRARIVFTTNFDNVVESAYAFVAEKSLTAFHLEGSYAALDALNAEQYPLYAKLHGDFRYQSVKNLSADLLANDKEIQRCLLAGATRYGIVISGYSGRDDNVMSMLRQAVQQNNAFPSGLIWTTTRANSVAPSVLSFLDFANSHGVNARLVVTGPFDEMLSKLWRQVPNKPETLDSKVRSALRKGTSIALPAPGQSYPILRTNALPVTSLPSSCGIVCHKGALNPYDIREQIFQKRPPAIIAVSDRIMYWGNSDAVATVLDRANIERFETHTFDNVVSELSNSRSIKGFFEESLGLALAHGKSLLVRRGKGNSFHLVVEHAASQSSAFAAFRSALTQFGKEGVVSGTVPGTNDLLWAESVSIKLEERNGKVWLLLWPDIWISPLNRRDEATDFLRKRRTWRYNGTSNALLSAWIELILGTLGDAKAVAVTAFPGTDSQATFEIGSRTGYSRRTTNV